MVMFTRLQKTDYGPKIVVLEKFVLVLISIGSDVVGWYPKPKGKTIKRKCPQYNWIIAKKTASNKTTMKLCKMQRKPVSKV